MTDVRTRWKKMVFAASGGTLIFHYVHRKPVYRSMWLLGERVNICKRRSGGVCCVCVGGG